MSSNLKIGDTCLVINPKRVGLIGESSQCTIVGIMHKDSAQTHPQIGKFTVSQDVWLVDVKFIAGKRTSRMHFAEEDIIVDFIAGEHLMKLDGHTQEDEVVDTIIEEERSLNGVV